MSISQIILYLLYDKLHVCLLLHRWPSFRISAQKLCSGDWERTLRFSVWDWDSDGTHDFIGEGTASLRDITPERYSVCVSGSDMGQAQMLKVLPPVQLHEAVYSLKHFAVVYLRLCSSIF